MCAESTAKATNENCRNAPCKANRLERSGIYTLIPHVVQTEADKVFVNILNNQASALSDGDAVVWNTSSPDGVRTTQAAATTLSLLVGIADGAIASAAYGLAQAYGYKAAALVTVDTTVSVVAGDILIAVASGDQLARSASGGTQGGYVYAAEAFVTDSTPVAATKKVFIRAL